MPIMKPSFAFAAIALTTSVPLPALGQDAEQPLTPSSVVANASADEWVAISPEYLLVMKLAPDDRGNARRVIIQLMPAPFSQPWVENIRGLARAQWWDGTSVYRVQDNYVTQWGDATEQKPLPEGVTSPVAGYEVDVDTLGEADDSASESTYALDDIPDGVLETLESPDAPEKQRYRALEVLVRTLGLDGKPGFTPREELAMLSINATQTRLTEQGWHDRDPFAQWVEFWQGWPIGNEERIHWEDDNGKVVPDPGRRLPPDQFAAPYRTADSSVFWPLHCNGYVGVARDYAPDTGTGAELYAIIGQPQRHMDRNLAVVGRVIEGMEHLSSLPRGSGDLGFYTEEEADLRTPIVSVRLASELADPPAFEYLDTSSESFALYLTVRANRNDAFYTVPAGGVDVCSVQVPVRRVE